MSRPVHFYLFQEKVDKESIEGGSPDSSERFDGWATVAPISWTLMVQWLTFLEDAPSTGSGHLLGVTQFVSGL